MKTKAEAIADPEEGDRWELLPRVRQVLVWNLGSHMMRFYEQNNDTEPVIQKASFRRWAQNATYLGGKDE